VGTMAVVVLDIEVQDVKKLPTPGDQKVVQALPAHGANPALGDGIGVRRLDRCADDLGADRAPDVVEDTGELAVTVVDQEPDGRGIVFEGSEEVRACWATQAPVGLAVTPARCTRRLCSWMKNSTYSRCRNTVSTGSKSQGHDGGCLPA
jgi:hypothetical protein